MPCVAVLSLSLSLSVSLCAWNIHCSRALQEPLQPARRAVATFLTHRSLGRRRQTALGRLVGVLPAFYAASPAMPPQITPSAHTLAKSLPQSLGMIERERETRRDRRLHAPSRHGRWGGGGGGSLMFSPPRGLPAQPTTILTSIGRYSRVEALANQQSRSRMLLDPLPRRRKRDGAVAAIATRLPCYCHGCLRNGREQDSLAKQKVNPPDGKLGGHGRKSLTQPTLDA
ncbi:hypothetical protein CGRA01v4_00034 [Colletotrichum graminicola]|nr:hypothetical protein CGRA01v4_00034 [Colletotrichum graminicola]